MNVSFNCSCQWISRHCPILIRTVNNYIDNLVIVGNHEFKSCLLILLWCKLGQKQFTFDGVDLLDLTVTLDAIIEHAEHIENPKAFKSGTKKKAPKKCYRHPTSKKKSLRGNIPSSSINMRRPTIIRTAWKDRRSATENGRRRNCL